MSDYNTQADNTVYGSFGEFEGYDQTADWTDEDWAQYDAYCSAEIAEFEEQEWHESQEDYRRLYSEAEADVIMAQYDVPDLDIY